MINSSRRIHQEQLLTHIETTIAGLEKCRKAYREFTTLPLAVQLCSERDTDNAGVSYRHLIDDLSRLDPGKKDSELYRDYVVPALQSGGLVRLEFRPFEYYFVQSDEMYATLEPIREFKRMIEERGGFVT